MNFVGVQQPTDTLETVDSLRHLVSILYLIASFSAYPGGNCTCQDGALIDLMEI